MIRRKMSLTGRVLITVLVLVVGAVSARAYTVVMRDGRRVEIPNNFTVTESTLTYEVSKGLQVTMQLSTVDVAATERANGEASGSFLTRATTPKPSIESAPQRQRARRSVTNADLEQYRRTRVEGEQAYERSRKELGLPSMEERRHEAAAIQERTLEQVRNMRKQQELEQEALWRARADLLRAQMEASETPFDNRRLSGDYPWAFSYGGFPLDGVGFGNGIGGFGRFNRLPVSLFPGFLSTPITPFPSIMPSRRPVFFNTPRTHIVRPVHRRNH